MLEGRCLVHGCMVFLTIGYGDVLYGMFAPVSVCDTLVASVRGTHRPMMTQEHGRAPPGALLEAVTTRRERANGRERASTGASVVFARAQRRAYARGTTLDGFGVCIDLIFSFASVCG
jgi:hypothetical protein